MKILLVTFLLLFISSCSKNKDNGETVFSSNVNIFADEQLIGYDLEVDDINRNKIWKSSGYPDDLRYKNLAIPLLDHYSNLNIESIKINRNFFNIINNPVISEKDFFIITTKGKLICFNKNTLKTKWIKKLNNTQKEAEIFLYSSIFYEQNVLYISLNDGRIIAINAKDGSVLWSKFFIRGGFNSQVNISGDVLYAIRSDNATIALNKQDGSVIWEHEMQQQHRSSFTMPYPIVSNNVIVSGYSNGYIVGLDKNTGKHVWMYNISDLVSDKSSIADTIDIDYAPIIIDNVLVVGSTVGGIVGIDLNSGMIIFESPFSVASDMSLIGEFVFFITKDSKLVCMHAKSGRIKWFQQLDAKKTLSVPKYLSRGSGKLDFNIRWFAPIIAGNKLLLTTPYGHVSFRDINTGSEISSREFNILTYSPPSIANRKLYMVDNYLGRIMIFE